MKDWQNEKDQPHHDPTARVVRAAEGGLSPRLKRFTEWKGNLVLGKYSYAIYLFHYPIAHTLQPASGGGLPKSLVAFALTTVASLAIARVTWVLWEQPWLRAGIILPIRLATLPSR